MKPISLIVKLLEDVPKDCGPVLDPFLGSGTSLVACAQTGHSAIGIERETEYFPIADARVRYWDKQNMHGEGCLIQSDVPQEPEPAKKPVSLWDLLEWW